MSGTPAPSTPKAGKEERRHGVKFSTRVENCLRLWREAEELENEAKMKKEMVKTMLRKKPDLARIIGEIRKVERGKPTSSSKRPAEKTPESASSKKKNRSSEKKALDDLLKEHA